VQADHSAPWWYVDKEKVEVTAVHRMCVVDTTETTLKRFAVKYYQTICIAHIKFLPTS
jgi:hypothetical protein